MNSLEEYRDFFLAQPCWNFRVIEMREYPSLTAMVVHRIPPFQVELVMVKPNMMLPPHRHPHIDAYEVHVNGDLRLVVGKDEKETKLLIDSARLIPERAFAKNRFFPIRSSDWHGGKSGDTGAIFWSIQKWHSGVKMTAAGIDWEGPSL